MEEIKLIDICKITEDDNSFVGFKIENSIPKVFLPIGYRIEIDTLEQDIDLFLSTIMEYKEYVKNSVDVNDEYENEYLFPYYSYKWLLRDFIEHGYYQEGENVYQKNLKGKINWKKTIKNIRPYISPNNNIIYLNYIVKKNKINEKNIITAIHKACVYESAKKIGWLFFNINIEKPNIELNDINRGYFLKILYEEYKNTFNDYKKSLLMNIINVINGIDSKKFNNEDIEFGVYKFHSVWENIVNIAFGDSKQINTLYQPKGRWILTNGVKKDSTSLRPDSLKIIGQTAYIYDAKYYTYGISKGIVDKLPSTESIHKQITYGDNLWQNFGPNSEKKIIKKIYNSFILPYNKENNDFGFSNDVEYIGYAIGMWNDESNLPEHQIIRTFLIDTKYLINEYKNIKKEKSNKIIEKLGSF